ncbi:MAG: ribosomal protein S18-alanine N-acetyltransferase [Actinomycetota bacterium]
MSTDVPPGASPRPVTLEPLTLDDLEETVALETRTYSTPWSEQVFRDELTADNRSYLKAVDPRGRLVGYAGLMEVGEEAHITTVVVDADYRGGRVGTRLMLELVTRAVERGARTLTLEVRVSNASAQALYRRFGMAPVGVRKGYYLDEDALVMWAHEIDSAAYAARLAEIRESLS